MSLAIRSIELYQRHISPHKGFCCAYRIANNDLSCSEFAKQRIMAKGLLKSLSDIRQRFGKCKQAALQLNELSGRKKSKTDRCTDYCRKNCDPSTCCISVPGDFSLPGTASGGCDGCACTPF